MGALSPRQVIEVTDSYNREVSMLSRLNHRNLPRIYDHFTDPTHWYVVMQYIEGRRSPTCSPTCMRKPHPSFSAM